MAREQRFQFQQQVLARFIILVDIFAVSDLRLDDICPALPIKCSKYFFGLKYIIRLGIKLGSRPLFSCMKTLRGEVYGAC